MQPVLVACARQLIEHIRYLFLQFDNIMTLFVEICQAKCHCFILHELAPFFVYFIRNPLSSFILIHGFTSTSIIYFCITFLTLFYSYKTSTYTLVFNSLCIIIVEMFLQQFWIVQAINSLPWSQRPLSGSIQNYLDFTKSSCRILIRTSFFDAGDTERHCFCCDRELHLVVC